MPTVGSAVGSAADSEPRTRRFSEAASSTHFVAMTSTTAEARPLSHHSVHNNHCRTASPRNTASRPPTRSPRRTRVSKPPLVPRVSAARARRTSSIDPSTERAIRAYHFHRSRHSPSSFQRVARSPTRLPTTLFILARETNTRARARPPAHPHHHRPRRPDDAPTTRPGITEHIHRPSRAPRVHRRVQRPARASHRSRPTVTPSRPRSRSRSRA